MILGIGLDILKISRFKDLHLKYGNKFLERIFTPEEIRKSHNFSSEKRVISYFAKRFSAKEAFAKAIGDGIGKNISFLDIEITNGENNKPLLKLSDKLTKYLSHIYGEIDLQFHITLSDEQDIASAMIIIEKK